MLAFVLAGGPGSVCEAAQLIRVRAHADAERTRVVLDLDGPCEYRQRLYGHGSRLEIVLQASSLRRPLAHLPSEGELTGLKAEQIGDDLHVLLELRRSCAPHSFALSASGARPARLVVDLVALAGEEMPPILEPRSDLPYVVVIDPGHGGHDTGAVGRGPAAEKDVVLGIARIMAALLQQHGGVEVVLTRHDDRFVPLAERVRIAQEAQGDLFVSIHCNSARRTSARGAEVYFLSLEGATDEAAKAAAHRENAALLVGEESANTARGELLDILVDLRGTSTLRRSSLLAEMALSQLRQNGGMAGRAVKQARFAVLRNLSMPAVLVEAGFVSHPEEARRLASQDGQRKVAHALAQAVVQFCRRSGEKGKLAPMGSLHVHTVERGDTLWELARLYRVSVDSIREVNALRDDRLRVGQRLVLP